MTRSAVLGYHWDDAFPSWFCTALAASLMSFVSPPPTSVNTRLNPVCYRSPGPWCTSLQRSKRKVCSALRLAAQVKTTNLKSTEKFVGDTLCETESLEISLA